MSSNRQPFAMSLLFTLALMLGCATPSEHRVIEDFHERHPTYKVIDANAGEGDSDNVYWYVRYVKPDSEGIFLAEWLYQKQQGGDWKVTLQKDPSQPCGKTIQDCDLTK